MANYRAHNHLFMALFLTTGVLVVFIFKPYADALVFGALLGLFFHPLFKKINQSLNSKSLAAFLVVLIILIAILIPSLILGNQIIQEARNLYWHISSNGGIANAVNNLPVKIPSFFSGDINSRLETNIADYLSRIINVILSKLSNVFSSVIQFIIKSVLALLACFYILKEDSAVANFLIKFSPLHHADSRRILNRLKKTSNVIVLGTLFIGLLQGILTGIGFALFGVPNPVFWGAIASVASLVPVLGTGLIIIPAILFLFASNLVLNGILLSIWGLTAVGLIDNLLRPFLVAKETSIHEFLVLLSVLGGLSFFGPVGFVMGPIILCLFFELLNLYSPDAKFHQSGEKVV